MLASAHHTSDGKSEGVVVFVECLTGTMGETHATHSLHFLVSLFQVLPVYGCPFVTFLLLSPNHKNYTIIRLLTNIVIIRSITVIIVITIASIIVVVFIFNIVVIINCCSTWYIITSSCLHRN